MAKSKKSKNKSDKLYAKRNKPTEKKLNPFELHINKEKHAILNKMEKGARGFPGRSRDKAFKVRKETIEQEYLTKHKRNVFKDNRMESGYEMSGRQHKKTAIYNLNDEEILTHQGLTLEQIERFDEPENQYDSDEDGKLDEAYTEAAHFGNDEAETGVKDRKSVIEELIADSKKRKAEKVKENQEVYDMTQVLDAHWKALVPLVGKLTKNDEQKSKPDEYDRTMRELIFERRGEPTNPLKSKEELERIEREKIRKLELERQKRMQDEEGDKVLKHRSADDLDDGYFIDDGTEPNELMVAYDIKSKDVNEDNSEEEKNYDHASESNEEIEGSEKNLSDEQDQSESENTDTEDNLSDLKESDSESDIDIENDKTTLSEPIITKTKSTVDTTKEEILSKNYRIPNKYEVFYNTICERPVKELGLILESMIKNNNLYPASERKPKLISLFAFLLQYVNDAFTSPNKDSVSEQFKILNDIVPHLYALNQQYSKETSECMQDVIKEKQDIYRKKAKFYPGLDTIVFFKIISLLFSTSDFKHPVVTPAVIFLNQILTRSRINSRKDVAIGLFLCTVYLEYSQLAKRLLPAVFNFLNGVIYLCINKRTVECQKVIPPFRRGSNMLALTSKLEVQKSNFKLTASDLVSMEMEDMFKLRALWTSLNLLNEFLLVHTENVGIHYFANSAYVFIEKLNKEVYSENIVTVIDNTLSTIKSCLELKVSYLVQAVRKPKALRLLEPKIEKVFDGYRKHQVTSKVKAEREKLMHKFKREKKGAIREIRRDNEFLKKFKLKRQIEGDRIRKEKVKRIYSEAFSQQGELKAMERKKRR